MDPSKTRDLDAQRLTQCPDCGAFVWEYKSPDGSDVALDAAPGPHLIDANNVVYRSEDNHAGFRGHSDVCNLAVSPLTGLVTGDDFLWP